MKKSFLLLLAIIAGGLAFADAYTITSADVELKFSSVSGGYQTHLKFQQNNVPFYVSGKPVVLEVMDATYSSYYKSVVAADSGYVCVADVESNNHSVFTVTDRYVNRGNGEIEVRRDVQVKTVGAGDTYFCSNFAIKTLDNASLTSNDYFVPGVMYKSYFDKECNTPADIPQVSDQWFLYRDDRTPLPFVMSRSKSTGVTINLALKDSKCQTVLSDYAGTQCNANYQFGSVGMCRNARKDATYQMVYYPGNTKDTKQGKGPRFHPVATDVNHKYNVYLKISKTGSYAEAAHDSWDNVFDLYNPAIYSVNLNTCYEGLISTLLTYYQASRADGGNYDKPGWPFEVSLSDFTAQGVNYQMGFVGMQVSSGYYLYRYGKENSNTTTSNKGIAVLDFWANDCFTSLNMPKTWYDPKKSKYSGSGSWRDYESILRVMTGGMVGLLNAYTYGQSIGDTHATWLTACTKYGDWLLGEQNANGSFAFSWDHTTTSAGHHPVVLDNGLTTTSTLRYLCELYTATGQQKYKTAAMKAGEYCLGAVHNKYHYCAGVVDNPQVLDSESGYLALQGFLAMYKLTSDPRYLNAACQAADYTESWVYCHEVPAENDATANSFFPNDRSVVGQHLIAIGHSGADLGFAYCSFEYYLLYLLTNNAHYLKMARMSAHNTKQSMNWDQSIYPGQPRGLQLEVFQVTIPRRKDAAEFALNWNYAGHLDPMFRFKDVFGTPDIEAVEAMTWETRQQKVADYGDVEYKVDYYLTHPYYFTDTKLTKDEAGEEVEYFNADDARIKLTADGWSDFHWNDDKGKSAAIFDGINMSHAGPYTLQFNSRGNWTALDIVVNGVTTTFNGDCSNLKMEHITLVEGENVIQFKKNDGWYNVYSLSISRDDNKPDYYLTHPYYFKDTKLTDTGTQDNSAEVYTNADGEYVKSADGVWSDFHWDGLSNCIFDEINMSQAGNYTLTLDYRGTTSDAIIAVNDMITHIALDGNPYEQVITLNAGMNTIKIGRGEWIGIRSIELSKVVVEDHSQEPDYYITNPYLFKDTKLTPTGEQDGSKDVYVNDDDEFIKMDSEYYSDFHWDGSSHCIFDGIYLTQAGKYDLIISYKGSSSDTEITINDDTYYRSLCSAPTASIRFEFNAGMNTVKIGKGEWINVYGIQLDGPHSDWATDIENVNASADVRKVLVNGQICIIRNGIVYNTMGQIIQ